MKKIFLKIIIISITLFNLPAFGLTNDPLPSWNNGPFKQKIIQFVHDISDKKSSNYTAPEDRIAVFDNDGTLLVEQPMYAQGVFAIDQIKTNASHHPEWYKANPYKKILMNYSSKLPKLTQNDFHDIFTATHSGMTVDEFHDAVSQWLKTSVNPEINRPYTQLFYQPMLEVINFLRKNQFEIYIVSGSGQEFLRPLAKQIYHIPSEHVIATIGKTDYLYREGKPVLVKRPEIFLMTDKQDKAIAINMFIGKHPLIAFGNSDGDRQMLEWTENQSGPHFTALVHHDDEKREFAYDNDSKIGRFSNDLMTEAQTHHWYVISMRHDWRVVFP